MKAFKLIFALACILSGVGVGCQSTAPCSRVVRLMFDKGGWELCVNGCETGKPISNGSLTNELESLRLKHGDIVLLGCVTNFNAQEETREWLSRYFDSGNVALYVYSNSDKAEFFSVPIYHWVAPFDNPRNFNQSSYFYEGKFLGVGMNGYKTMVQEIQDSHKPRIFVLGSLYDINKGFGPLESPYGNYEQLLRDTMSKNNIELLLPSQLPGL